MFYQKKKKKKEFAKKAKERTTIETFLKTKNFPRSTTVTQNRTSSFDILKWRLDHNQIVLPRNSTRTKKECVNQREAREISYLWDALVYVELAEGSSANRIAIMLPPILNNINSDILTLYTNPGSGRSVATRATRGRYAEIGVKR